MSDPIDKFDLLLELMRENKEDLKSLRQGSHDIRDHMAGLSGSINLIRLSQENKQEQDNQRFNVVHDRVDKEQAITAKKFQEIQAVLNDIAPKVTHMNKIFDWATRLIVGALVGAILWALTQSIMV
jgi:uncharacterized protein YhaN